MAHMVHKWDNIDFEIILRLVGGEAHLRQISKEIKVPHSTLSRRLASLRKEQVIDFRLEGKNNKYFIKKSLIAKKAAIMAEGYKFIKTLTRYHFLSPIFQDIAEKSKDELIILFGSYAKGIPREDSDIDIYIETKDEKIKEEVKKINDLINVKTGRFDTEDLLIKEIIKNHVIIRGAEEYYEKIKFFR